jgi:plasmid stability protein
VAARARPRAWRFRTQDPCYTEPVANLTLSIDDALLRRARIRALEQGTSVNAVVRDLLAAYADDRAVAGRRRVVAIARSAGAGGAGRGRAWTRDDVYAERGRGG